ncbi:MAG TPA: leucyl aminopeptidase [Oscillatoriaceae cyanobacterium]
MNVNVKASKLAELQADALVVGLFEGASANEGLAKDLDGATNGLLGGVLAAGDFKGKPGQALVLHLTGAIKRLVLVGLGKSGELTLEKLRNVGGKGTTIARDAGAKAIAVAVSGTEPGQWSPATGAFDAEVAAQAIAEGALLSLYQMNAYRTKDREEIKTVDSVTFWTPEASHQEAIKAGVATAQVLADSIALTRDLVVQPGNVITATRMAEEVQKMGKEVGLKVTVLDKPELEKRGFGGLLGVNRGSVEPPKFIIMEWNGGPKDEAPIVLIGKGITFDTGGISIKPAEGMEKMKYDMAGGGATIGAMRAIAKLGLKRNVVGLVPATDNMPSGSALKPGDVITAYGGQTVEVLNTDAEGRLVLMDALAYASKDLKAQAVIDMATLTGACVIALGTDAMAVLGNNQELVDRVLAAGEKTGDRGWQLPMWKEYNELLRSDIADMKNIGGREAGTITAACFLGRHVGEKTPWVHLDIAGTAWTEKEKPYRPKGPTGVPVRLLVDLVRDWQGAPKS